MVNKCSSQYLCFIEIFNKKDFFIQSSFNRTLKKIFFCKSINDEISKLLQCYYLNSSIN